MATAGASRGPRTAAFSTIAPPRGPMEAPGANEKNSSGGTKRKRTGPASMFPISTCTSRPITSRREGAEGDAAIPGDKPFIMHPDGFGWIWVASGLKDGPLPAHYEPLESPIAEPDLSGAAHRSRRPRSSKAPENRYAEIARRAISLRVDHLPADRTSHRRRNVALPRAPCGASAGAFLRDFARAGRGIGHRAWRMGHRRHGARIDRGARDGHRSHEAGHARRTSASIRWAFRITGATKGW